MRLRRFFVVTLALAINATASASALAQPWHPDFTAKLSEAGKDTDALVELARWCRDRNYVRELLVATDRILEQDPEHEIAHQLCGRRPVDSEWVLQLPDAQSWASPASAPAIEPDRYEAIIEEAVDQTRWRSKSKRWFAYETDVARQRLEEIDATMWSYFDATRKTFGNTKNKLGIPVRIYGSRADYLEFYDRRMGRSGENVLGFYTWRNADDGGMLCFFDDPYDTEQVLDTARHESAHLLMRQTLQGAYLPIWLEEGLAVYLAGLQRERAGPYAANCAIVVRRGLEDGTSIPFDRLLKTPQAEFDALHYAYAWTWVSYLMSTEAGEKRMKSFFANLRSMAKSSTARDWTRDDWMRESQVVFLDDFEGHLDQAGWVRHVVDEIVPTSSAQRLDYAAASLSRLLYQELPTFRSRVKLVRCLHEAEDWLHRASIDTTRDHLARRIELARLEALLIRMYVMVYLDAREVLYVLANVVTTLARNVEAEEDPDSLADIAGFAQRMSEVVKNLPTVAGKGMDKARAQAKLEKGAREEIDAWAKLLPEIARTASLRALAVDPAHRPAAEHLLFLGILRESRADVEAAFPFLRLQVERDPSDVALAALGAAYKALGHANYGLELYERARLISRDSGLMRYEWAFE